MSKIASAPKARASRYLVFFDDEILAQNGLRARSANRGQASNVHSEMDAVREH